MSSSSSRHFIVYTTPTLHGSPLQGNRKGVLHPPASATSGEFPAYKRDDASRANGTDGGQVERADCYVTPDSARASAASVTPAMKVMYSDVEDSEQVEVRRNQACGEYSSSDSETDTESEETETCISDSSITTDYTDGNDGVSAHTSAMEDEDGEEQAWIDFDEPIYLSVGMRMPPASSAEENEDAEVAEEPAGGEKKRVEQADAEEGLSLDGQKRACSADSIDWTELSMYVDYQQSESALERGTHPIGEGLKRRRRSVDFFDYNRKSHSAEKSQMHRTSRRSSITITSSYALPPSNYESHSEYTVAVSSSVNTSQDIKIFTSSYTSEVSAVIPTAAPDASKETSALAERQTSGEDSLASSKDLESDGAYVALSKHLTDQANSPILEGMDQLTQELGMELIRDIQEAELKCRFLRFLSAQQSSSRQRLIRMFLAKHESPKLEYDWPLLEPEGKRRQQEEPRGRRAKGEEDQEKKKKLKKEKNERKAKKERKRTTTQDKTKREPCRVRTAEAELTSRNAITTMTNEGGEEKEMNKMKRREKWKAHLRERRKERKEKKEKKQREHKSTEREKRKTKENLVVRIKQAPSVKPQRTQRQLKKENSGLTKRDMDFDRRWNEEYQSVLDKGIEKVTPDDLRKLSKLMHDFVYNAETYAKVIINELNVDEKKKTIKPASVGGVAGGEKYIVQGILFKFCRDPMISQNPPTWLYGGWRPVDEYAMKAAGLELQGLALAADPRLLTLFRHPLMTLIDYKGFRIVATCILPLGPNTLCYGSNDGGKTVLARDPTFNKAMESLGKLLNLKKHTVGRHRVPIIGPGDCEGHLGQDGRYYMLDYARLMPPEAPDIRDETTGDRSVFFKMLRPEIVRRFPRPLSSDAFTGWSKYDMDVDNSERDIRLATKILMEEAIPGLARELDEIDISEVIADLSGDEELNLQRMYINLFERINLVYRMHSRGINMRHLGRLRQAVTSQDWKQLILWEAISRLAKQLIKEKMRQAMTQSFGVSSESLCKDLILEYLNNAVGHTEARRAHSDNLVKPRLMERFPGILTEEEMQPNYVLQTKASVRFVFIVERRIELIRLTDHITHKMLSDPLNSVRVLPNDVESMVASVKKPPLSHMVDASMYITEALEGTCNDGEAIRLLETALEHLSIAGNVMPCVPFIVWAIGRVEMEMARRKPFGEETELLFHQAITNHRRSLLLELEAGPINSLAATLELYATRLAEEQRAQSKLISSTSQGVLSSRRLGQSAAALLTRSNSSTTSHVSASSSKPRSPSRSASEPAPLKPSKLSTYGSMPSMLTCSSAFPSLRAIAATIFFSSSSSFLATLGHSHPTMARLRCLREIATKLRELAKHLLVDMSAGPEAGIERLLGS